MEKEGYFLYEAGNLGGNDQGDLKLVLKFFVLRYNKTMKRISTMIIKIFLFSLFSIYQVQALEINIDSNHAILYNTKENKIVYEKKSTEKVSIASLTKITTALVALENIKDLDEKVILTREDFQGLYEANAAVAGFKVGEEVTYRDLLYGLLLPSGADAAQALERTVAGSNEEFINLMNEKAKELKLENTHYQNPTGLDDENHYSTVKDVLTVFQYALKNPDFKTIITTQKYTTSNQAHIFTSTLRKVQSLEMDYVLGGKTGTTEDAGLCLATLANFDDTDFLLVTAKAEYSKTTPRNFLDHKTIYEYVKDNYDYQEVVNKKNILVTLKTEYLKEDKIDFYSKDNKSFYLENNFDKDKVKYQYTGIKKITPNHKKGQKLGKVKIYYDNQLLDTEDIILLEKPKLSIPKYLVGHQKEIILFGLLIFLMISFHKKKKKD